MKIKKKKRGVLPLPPPSPHCRRSLFLQRVVNERIVSDSVQINRAALIFISHVTRETLSLSLSLTGETIRERP